MTVRVTKPKFNLREKISELDKPTGLKGSELMRSETSQEARDLIGANSGRRNLFINGDMRIDQRSNGAASTPSVTSFTSVDRWKAVINPGSKFSMQQKSDGTIPGLPYYMRLTSLAATTLGGSQYELFWQTIEAKNLFDLTGFGKTGAKDLTLSFWVRSSVAGPFSGALENWAQDRAFVWQVDINNKDTWEHKTVHIPPCTDGLWQTNTTNGAYFMFNLGTTIATEPNTGWVNGQRLGSSTDIRRIGISGATVDLTGCQLEVGKVATEFDHRPYSEELQMCQRYFTFIPSGTTVAGRGNSTSSYMYSYQTPVPMRVSPTVGTDNDLAHGTFSVRRYRDATGVSDSTSTPTTSTTYFRGNTANITFYQGGFTGADDRSATLFLSGGAITLSAEI